MPILVDIKMINKYMGLTRMKEKYVSEYHPKRLTNLLRNKRENHHTLKNHS